MRAVTELEHAVICRIQSGGDPYGLYADRRNYGPVTQAIRRLRRMGLVHKARLRLTQAGEAASGPLCTCSPYRVIKRSAHESWCYPNGSRPA